MAIHLRQICLVASDLTKSVENLSEILSIPPCFWDPSVGEFGLKNTLLRVGTDFIEIVSPEQENTAANTKNKHTVRTEDASRARALPERARAFDALCLVFHKRGAHVRGYTCPNTNVYWLA